MKDYFEEINSLEYLFLVDIKNLPGNKISVTVKEATIGSEEEDLFISGENLGPVKGIHEDGPGKIYEFYFQSFGSYNITNESFSILNEKDERIGRLFCKYSKSSYLDYIRATTLVDHIYDNHGEQLKHFSINCLHHTIDIITIDEPIIKRIEK